MLNMLDDIDTNVHVYMSNSGLLDLYIYNRLKKICKADTDSIFYVKKASDMVEIEELSLVFPSLAKQWLFIVEGTKVPYGRLVKFLNSKPESMKVLVKVESYTDFLELKKNIKVAPLNFMYLKNLNKEDFKYLFQGKVLTPQLLDFIFYSYRLEVEKIMEVRQFLEGGGRLPDRRSVTDLVGVSAGSIEHFVSSLITTKLKTTKSKDMLLKRRISVLVGLSEIYGVSKLRNILLATAKDYLDIKTLYLSGAVYKSLDNIPKGYDEKRLSRYKYKYSTIITYPYSSLVNLYLCLNNQGAWNVNSDMLRFIYNYFQTLERVEE